MVLGYIGPRPGMEEVLTVIIVISLVFFTAWLSKLSAQLNEGLNGLGVTDDDVQEIKDGIDTLATVFDPSPRSNAPIQHEH